MKQETYNLIKLEAEAGKVFDWANLDDHIIEEVNPETGETEKVQDHLYAKIIYLGDGDSADNYIEVDDPNFLQIGE